MRATTVQAFTTSVGRRFFVVLPRPEDPRVPVKCNALTQELELLDAVIEGPLEARLLNLHDQDRERLTPWLERTGWVGHLGNLPLLPLALSVTLPNIVQLGNTPVWMETVLDRVAQAFTALWAAAEHAISTESMNCTLVLLKTYKRDGHSGSGHDLAPFRIPTQTATRDRYRNQWLTYVMFCCRWYLEHISSHNALSDKSRVIVAPHLFPLAEHQHMPMVAVPEDEDLDIDVTSLSWNGSNRYNYHC